MALASCTVSFTDADNVEHSVQVQAESAYEAAAMALRQFHTDPLTRPVIEDANVLLIETQPKPVKHTLRLAKFKEWVGRNNVGSPAERSRRLRVQALLKP